MFELNSANADVIFLGDSITARGHWEEFFPNINVLNRGIGSDVSAGVLHRLDEIVERKPSKIFILIGINDLAKGISQKTTIDNIKAIVDTLQEALPNGEIYLESVLPTTALALEKIEALNQEIEIVAEQNDNVFYVDIYSLLLTEDSTIKSEVLSADGVHLNGEGYQIWIEAIKDKVNN